MRKMIVIAIAAAGFALAAVPGASAAPLYGTGPASAAAGVDLSQDVYHRRWHHRRWHHRHWHHRHWHHGPRCWWRHGHRVCRW